MLRFYLNDILEQFFCLNIVDVLQKTRQIIVTKDHVLPYINLFLCVL